MKWCYNSPKYLYPGIEVAAHPYEAVAALKEYFSPTEESFFSIFCGLLLARSTWEQPQTVWQNKAHVGSACEGGDRLS